MFCCYQQIYFYYYAPGNYILDCLKMFRQFLKHERTIKLIDRKSDKCDGCDTITSVYNKFNCAPASHFAAEIVHRYCFNCVRAMVLSAVKGDHPVIKEGICCPNCQNVIKADGSLLFII